MNKFVTKSQPRDRKSEHINNYDSHIYTNNQHINIHTYIERNIGNGQIRAENEYMVNKLQIAQEKNQKQQQYAARH